MTAAVGSVRPGGRSAQVRRAILDATRGLLGEAGWAGFSVDEVARRAGVHKTTVYRRWPNKLELVVAALADRSDTMVAIPDTGSVRDDLRALAGSVLDNLTDPPGAGLARALAAEMATDPDVVRVARAFFHDRFARAAEVVERAVTRGEMSPRVDPDLLVEAVVAPIWFRFLATGDLSTRAQSYEVVDMLLDGVLLRPGPTA